MKADPGKVHVCMLGMCAAVCVCIVLLLRRFMDNTFVSQLASIAWQTQLRVRLRKLHFIMATKISNWNRSGDTTYIHI